MNHLAEEHTELYSNHRTYESVGHSEFGEFNWKTLKERINLIFYFYFFAKKCQKPNVAYTHDELRSLYQLEGIETRLKKNKIFGKCETDKHTLTFRKLDI